MIYINSNGLLEKYRTLSTVTYRGLIEVQIVKIAIPMLITRKLSDTTAMNAAVMQSSQNPKAVPVSSRRNHAEVCKSWRKKEEVNDTFLCQNHMKGSPSICESYGK
jgi:hypothetical protein